MICGSAPSWTTGSRSAASTCPVRFADARHFTPTSACWLNLVERGGREGADRRRTLGKLAHELSSDALCDARTRLHVRVR
jgi:hypothetical protein